MKNGVSVDEPSQFDTEKYLLQNSKNSKLAEQFQLELTVKELQLVVREWLKPGVSGPRPGNPDHSATLTP